MLSAQAIAALESIIVRTNEGQTILNVVRGEHGIGPEREMVLQLTAWLMPKAMLEAPKAESPPPNRAARRRVRSSKEKKDA